MGRRSVMKHKKEQQGTERNIEAWGGTSQRSIKRSNKTWKRVVKHREEH
jgi:hypothetical protein